jgi:hypothetical protein
MCTVAAQQAVEAGARVRRDDDVSQVFDAAGPT